MNRQCKIALIAILLITCAFCQNVQAISVQREISELYQKGEYQKVADLIENHLAESREPAESKNKSPAVSRREDMRLKLMLADIYGWHLGKSEIAIEIYESLASEKQLSLLINIADLHEIKGDMETTLKTLNRYLEVSGEMAKKERDTEMVMMLGAIDDYVKYRIDGLNLKKKTTGYELLIKDIKLAELSLTSDPGKMMVLMFMGAALNGGMDINPSAMENKAALANFINNNPKSFKQELTELSLIMNLYQRVPEEMVSDDLVRIYTKKYQGSYYPLVLLATMKDHHIYIDENDKGEIYLEEIRDILKSRRVKLIESGDPRFGSPESTWENYRAALIKGDLQAALECHVPWDQNYRQMYAAIGADRLKEIGREMRDVEKVISDEGSAKYRLLRNIKGTDITFYVRFLKVYGEWKIEQY